MESSGGGEQNYWPAFVDALSNVVLTLVFVLVIFVFALVMASNKVEKKMQEIISAHSQQDEDTRQLAMVRQEAERVVSELQIKLSSLTAEVEDLRQKKACAVTDEGASITVADTEEKNKEGVVKLDRKGNGLTIVFPPNVIKIDDAAAAQARDALEEIRKKVGGQASILLRSVIGRESYSAANRMAYYRAISVRNMLVAQGSDPAAISSTIIQSRNEEDGHVEIIFQKK